LSAWRDTLGFDDVGYGEVRDNVFVVRAWARRGLARLGWVWSGVAGPGEVWYG